MLTMQNHLLQALPPADLKRLLGSCERVDLLLAEVVWEPGEPLRHVDFVTDGFISLVALLEGHPGLEVGMVGREGMLGAQLALGLKTAPLRAVVQGGGSALRISSAAFNIELERSAPLRRVVNRYLSVLMAHLAASIACARFHMIGPRLARWLLMSQDRALADSFPMTHEFLAYMLGVRRVGVTVAASALQRGGLIEYHRGHMTVLDRAGLEAAACSCYASDLNAYAALA